MRNVRQGSSLKLKLAAYDICCKISVDFQYRALGERLCGTAQGCGIFGGAPGARGISNIQMRQVETLASYTNTRPDCEHIRMTYKTKHGSMLATEREVEVEGDLSRIPSVCILINVKSIPVYFILTTHNSKQNIWWYIYRARLP